MVGYASLKFRGEVKLKISILELLVLDIIFKIEDYKKLFKE